MQVKTWSVASLYGFQGEQPSWVTASQGCHGHQAWLSSILSLSLGASLSHSLKEA